MTTQAALNQLREDLLNEVCRLEGYLECQTAQWRELDERLTELSGNYERLSEHLVRLGGHVDRLVKEKQTLLLVIAEMSIRKRGLSRNLAR